MTQGVMELREKEGDGAFHPSIQYFLGKLAFYWYVWKKAVFVVCSDSYNNWSAKN